MSQFNRNSAFYSGSTRYGGSAAVTKRREAARKAFFTILEAPASSRSSTIKSQGMVQSFTINNTDIIRREPVIPQLSSSAKRILSWIEGIQPETTQNIQLEKRRKTRNRFNPMPCRPPISRIPAPVAPIAPVAAEPLMGIVPKLSLANSHSPPKVPKLAEAPASVVERVAPVPTAPAVFSTASSIFSAPPVSSLPVAVKKLTPIVNTEVNQTLQNTQPTPKPLPAVEPPISTRFKSSRYYGPKTEIQPSFCMSRKFTAPSRNLVPPPPLPELPKPTVFPATTVASEPFKNTTFKLSQETSKPPEVPKLAETPVNEFKITAPVSSAPPVFSTPSSIFSTASSIFSAPPASSLPVAVKKLTPIVNTEVNQTLQNTQPTPKPLPAVEPPISTRFKSSRYYGPKTEIQPSFCMSRKFTEPSRNLVPPPPLQELPKPTVFPITPVAAEPFKDLASKLSQENSKPPEVPKLAETPVSEVKITAPVSSAPSVFSTASSIFSTPPVFSATLATTKSSPIVDVEMDIDAEPQPVQQIQQTQPTQPAPPSTSSGPAAPIATQPLFMPPPSFPTHTFTPPMPPVTSGIPMLNGSNPFQPTSSSVRGRKILRPQRRLHR